MRMTKLFILIIFIFANCCSCSNLSQHIVTDGKIDITGGVYHDREWNGAMTLLRKTWYKELTMVYDVLLYDLKRESDFLSWVSKEEKDFISSCKSFLLGIVYVSEDFGGNYRTFKNEMENNEFKEYPIMNFAKHLKGHPDYTKWTLQDYKIEGYCSQEKIVEELKINLPGFKEVKIKI